MERERLKTKENSDGDVMDIEEKKETQKRKKKKKSDNEEETNIDDELKRKGRQMITLADLLREELLKPGDELTYKGTKGIVERTGDIMCNNKQYRSVSDWCTNIARANGSAAGTRRSGWEDVEVHGRRLKQVKMEYIDKRDKGELKFPEPAAPDRPKAQRHKESSDSAKEDHPEGTQPPEQTEESKPKKPRKAKVKQEHETQSKKEKMQEDAAANVLAKLESQATPSSSSSGSTTTTTTTTTTTSTTPTTNSATNSNSTTTPTAEHKDRKTAPAVNPTTQQTTPNTAPQLSSNGHLANTKHDHPKIGMFVDSLSTRQSVMSSPSFPVVSPVNSNNNTVSTSGVTSVATSSAVTHIPNPSSSPSFVIPSSSRLQGTCVIPLIVLVIPTTQLNFTGETVGNGKYGVIFRYEWQDADVAAQRASKDRFFIEWENASEFVHPNIVTLFGHSTLNNELYMIFEFMNCGTLNDFITNGGTQLMKDPRMYYYIARNMAKVLCYIHSKGRILRDLTSKSFLLRAAIAQMGIVNLEIKLGDLGISDDDYATAALANDTFAKPFLPPEVKAEKPIFTRKADVFGFGMILCHLFSEGLDLSYVDEIITNSSIIKTNGWDELITCCLSEQAMDRPDFSLLMSWMPK